MDLRRNINYFVHDCKFLGTRLQSEEQESITEVDLVMLRAQLFLLDTAVSNLLELRRHQQQPPTMVDTDISSSTIEPA